jgi:hypothetical protein
MTLIKLAPTKPFKPVSLYYYTYGSSIDSGSYDMFVTGAKDGWYDVADDERLYQLFIRSSYSASSGPKDSKRNGIYKKLSHTVTIGSKSFVIPHGERFGSDIITEMLSLQDNSGSNRNRFFLNDMQVEGSTVEEMTEILSHLPLISSDVELVPRMTLKQGAILDLSGLGGEIEYYDDITVNLLLTDITSALSKKYGYPMSNWYWVYKDSPNDVVENNSSIVAKTLLPRISTSFLLYDRFAKNFRSIMCSVTDNIVSKVQEVISDTPRTGYHFVGVYEHSPYYEDTSVGSDDDSDIIGSLISESLSVRDREPKFPLVAVSVKDGDALSFISPIDNTLRIDMAEVRDPSDEIYYEHRIVSISRYMNGSWTEIWNLQDATGFYTSSNHRAVYKFPVSIDHTVDTNLGLVSVPISSVISTFNNCTLSLTQSHVMNQDTVVWSSASGTFTMTGLNGLGCLFVLPDGTGGIKLKNGWYRLDDYGSSIYTHILPPTGLLTDTTSGSTTTRKWYGTKMLNTNGKEYTSYVNYFSSTSVGNKKGAISDGEVYLLNLINGAINRAQLITFTYNYTYNSSAVLSDSNMVVDSNMDVFSSIYPVTMSKSLTVSYTK